MITIQELLYNRGLNRLAKIKLVRHKDKRLDLYNLYRTDRNSFWDYQNTQSKDVFKGVWKIQCKLPPKTKRFCPLVLK